jgi:cysteine desulfurase / selenocysteine lyase
MFNIVPGSVRIWKNLGNFCMENNLIFVVNATQALGIFPVDVKKCNIDFLVFTGLKWATAGYGIGGLYVNKKWLVTRKFSICRLA